jgi:hypothetical protein
MRRQHYSAASVVENENHFQQLMLIMQDGNLRERIRGCSVREIGRQAA